MRYLYGYLLVFFSLFAFITANGSPTLFDTDLYQLPQKSISKTQFIADKEKMLYHYAGGYPKVSIFTKTS